MLQTRLMRKPKLMPKTPRKKKARKRPRTVKAKMMLPRMRLLRVFQSKLTKIKRRL